MDSHRGADRVGSPAAPAAIEFRPRRGVLPAAGEPGSFSLGAMGMFLAALAGQFALARSCRRSVHQVVRDAGVAPRRPGVAGGSAALPGERAFSKRAPAPNGGGGPVRRPFRFAGHPAPGEALCLAGIRATISFSRPSANSSSGKPSSPLPLKPGGRDLDRRSKCGCGAWPSSKRSPRSPVTPTNIPRILSRNCCPPRRRAHRSGRFGASTSPRVSMRPQRHCAGTPEPAHHDQRLEHVRQEHLAAGHRRRISSSLRPARRCARGNSA